MKVLLKSEEKPCSIFQEPGTVYGDDVHTLRKWVREIGNVWMFAE